MVFGFFAASQPKRPSSCFISVTTPARYSLPSFKLMNPGFTDSTLSNIAFPVKASAILSEIINGAHLYSFAAAIAPLHWYSHKSGRLDKVTFPYFASYPLSTNAFVTSSVMLSIKIFIVWSPFLSPIYALFYT